MTFFPIVCADGLRCRPLVWGPSWPDPEAASKEGGKNGSLEPSYGVCLLSRSCCNGLRSQLGPHSFVAYTAVSEGQCFSLLKRVVPLANLAESGTGLGVCISNKLPGDANAASPWSPFSSKGAPSRPECDGS
uniref:Uncharacterized protein n=1 Tax=Theropithecus gelada TaxID=9565 RepID=A0A8D2FLZ5_THEGE